MLSLLALLGLPVVERPLRVDGIDFIVRLDGRANRPLQVWRDGRLIAAALSKSFTPWSLQVADVDGGGRDEICVGLTKSTHQFDFRHRTLFVMRFDGEQIFRKWAGSTLGRPLLEYCFGPKEPGKPQILFTLESKLDGSVALSANRWMGFGFRKLGAERIWKRADSLRLESESLILRANGERVSIPWKSIL